MGRESSELPQFNNFNSSPPTPLECVKGFRTPSSTSLTSLTSLSRTGSQLSRTSTCNSRVVTPTEFAFDWVLKIVGVAAAILFGIWAPVSYNAQSSGNASNDQSQTTLISKVDRLADEIESLQGVIEGLGALRAYEFCNTEANGKLPGCEYLTERLEIDPLLRKLVVEPKHNPSSRRTSIPSSPTSTPSPTSTSYSDIVSRSLDSLVQATSPSQIDSPSTQIESSTPPTTLPDSPASKPTDFAVGSLPRIALSAGFLFGFIVCLVVLGGRNVLKRARQRREEERGILNEKLRW